ncbi:amidase [Acuticoccus sp. M5D2P5]|uniref:amidase n=1 Tax=Acuticoccus kalidii TaxID=2910977 RepID=UPI001F3CD564|nr:amidase [Acuticoccus kalidii]
MTPAFTPIADLVTDIEEKEIEPAEIVASCGAEIARFNDRFRAYSHLCEDIEAQLANLPDGPLRGITVSVKGNIPVAGMPLTEGSAIFADRRATADAAIVARLRAAGAVILGHTTLSELAMYGVTNPFEPMGLNPYDVTRTAGGSSTGAGVAAALGMAHINIGTDSGGSIRNPACHCGVVGFMPRIGVLPLGGKVNHTPSLSTLGIIARSVDDVALAFAATAEPHEPAPPLKKRLIVPSRLIETMCDAETLALFEAALKRASAAGFDLVERDVEGWIAAERAAGIVSMAEGGRALAAMDISRASDGIKARAAAAANLEPAEVDAARAACATFKDALAAALDGCGADAVITPTWPFPAPAIDATEAEAKGKRVPIDPHRNCFVRVGNAVDAVALTLPMGLYTVGVPAGLHLMALKDDAQMLRVAKILEDALPESPRPPVL